MSETKNLIPSLTIADIDKINAILVRGNDAHVEMRKNGPVIIEIKIIAKSPVGN